KEKFQDIERQFALDDFNVAGDRFLRIGRETENIAGIGNCAVIAPLLQHFAILGDLVLPLLGCNEIVGIDVLKSDENTSHSGLRRFFDEVRNLVAERVDLDCKSKTRKLGLAQMNKAVEQQFPIAIPREIIIRYEEAFDALRMILANDLFEIVGRTKPALAPLHIDDGAERALIWAASPEIDAGERSRGPPHVLSRQERRRLAGQRRQLVHVIVQRLELSIPRILQNFIKPPFLAFAGE